MTWGIWKIFTPEHLKVSKLGLWWDSFIRSRKCMSLKLKKGVMSLLNRVSCVLVWSKCQGSNVPKACQLLIFTCQRAKAMSTCQKACQFFSFGSKMAFQLFNCFSKEFFNFWIFQLCLTFAYFKNIWAILENLSGETKNLNLYICKISSRKCKINSFVVMVLKLLSKICKLLL